MRLKHLSPLEYGIPVPNTDDQMIIIGIIIDGTDEILCIVDKATGKYYIERLLKVWSSLDKYSMANTTTISDEEGWQEYNKFFADNGLELILDGMKHTKKQYEQRATCLQ